jgi:hypothetical protein
MFKQRKKVKKPGEGNGNGFGVDEALENIEIDSVIDNIDNSLAQAELERQREVERERKRNRSGCGCW